MPDTAAIMTSRIHSLSAHLIAQPRDVHNRRPLRSLIQQRVKVLKYLRTLKLAGPRVGVRLPQAAKCP